MTLPPRKRDYNVYISHKERLKRHRAICAQLTQNFLNELIAKEQAEAATILECNNGRTATTEPTAQESDR